MNKGIVVEITDDSLTILSPDGQFHRIMRMGRLCQIGEEVIFAAPPVKRRVWKISFTSALAAAVVLCFIVWTGLYSDSKVGTAIIAQQPMVAAYVTFDINPSIELGIDEAEHVLEATGLNDDGLKLLTNLKLQGKSLDTAADDLLKELELKGYLSKSDGDIIITSTAANPQTKIVDTQIAGKMKQKVEADLHLHHAKTEARFQVTAMAAPEEVRKEAMTKGVSTGKFAVYLNAKSKGRSIPLGDFKVESIHQIAQKNGGIGKLINSDDPPSKQNLTDLLKKENSGELDAALNIDLTDHGLVDSKNPKKNNKKQNNGKSTTKDEQNANDASKSSDEKSKAANDKSKAANDMSKTKTDNKNKNKTDVKNKETASKSKDNKDPNNVTGKNEDNSGDSTNQDNTFPSDHKNAVDNPAPSDQTGNNTDGSGSVNK